jgi:hypothetical protein
MIEFLYWGFWFCVFVLLVRGAMAVAEDSPVVAFFGFLIVLGICAVMAMGIWDEVNSDHYSISKNSWDCTAWVGHYNAPTYVKSGNVMVPIGGGETKECTQYNKVR